MPKNVATGLDAVDRLVREQVCTGREKYGGGWGWRWRWRWGGTWKAVSYEASFPETLLQVELAFSSVNVVCRHHPTDSIFVVINPSICTYRPLPPYRHDHHRLWLGLMSIFLWSVTWPKRIEGCYGPVFRNFVLRDPAHATAVEVRAMC